MTQSPPKPGERDLVNLGTILRSFVANIEAIPEWAQCQTCKYFAINGTPDIWKFWIFTVIGATPFAPWFRAKIYIWMVFEYEIIEKTTALYLAYDENHRGQNPRCECEEKLKSRLSTQDRIHRSRLDNAGLPNLRVMKSLDNFKKRPGTEEMLETARQFMDEEIEQTLILLGDPGTGKSHVGLSVIGNALENGESAKFMTWSDIRDTLLSVYQQTGNNTEESAADDALISIQRQFINYKWLVIDDIGRGAPLSRWAAEQLSNILDQRMNDYEKFTVITTNLRINAFEEYLGHVIASRLKAQRSTNEETPRHVFVDASDYRIGLEEGEE